MAISNDDVAALKDAFEKVIQELSKSTVITSNVATKETLDLHIGTPSDTQFKKIQALTGVESSPEEWMVVPLHASNNLVDLGYRRWHKNVLEQMANTFVGRPHILDHEWYDSEYAVSFIFDCQLVTSEPTDELLQMGGFEEYNKKIVEKEGLHWVFMNVAVSKNHDAAEAIASRRYNDCSTGSILTNPKYICPNCSEDLGRDVSFHEKDDNGRYICPHMIPSRFAFWLYDGDDVKFADYAILNADHHEAVEISSCIRGALPGASVIRE